MRILLLIFIILSLLSFTIQTTVQVSWEATPGGDTSVLSYLITADYKEQSRYLDAILEALESSSSGDIITRKLGLKAEIITGYSAWEGKIGAGAQSFFKMDTSSSEIPESQKILLNQYSALLGFLLRQDAVIWYYHDPKNSSLLERNGMEARFSGNLTEKEFWDIYKQLHNEFQTWDIAPGYLPHGFSVLNFEENITNATFQKGMKKVLKKNRLMAKGLKKEKQFKSIGEYISNDWGIFPEGEEYFQVVADEDLWEWAKEIRKFRIDVVNDEFEPKNRIKHFLQK